MGYWIRSVQVNGCSQLGLDPLGQHGGDTSGCEDSLVFLSLWPLTHFLGLLWLWVERAKVL